MTLKLIDQVLTAAISLLVYGSEFWFTLAFALYVVTHDHENLEKTLPAARPAARPVAKPPAFKKDSFIPAQAVSSQAIFVSEKTPSTEVFSEKSLSPKVASSVASLKDIFPKPLSAKVSSKKISSQKTVLQPVTCEPVNWKKWKAADLRKASIAKACGVRMTPIGSRRKLTKADLIAQYEQNLKRLTRSPMPLSASLKSSQTA